MVSFVVATAENNVIGHDNQLLWHLPDDLKHFKRLTQGHPVIMGRRTYDSIGRALPDRANIVITRQQNWQAPGCEVAYSVPAALERAAKLDAEVFVIGGAEIYRQAMQAADTIHLTEVHHSFEGDTVFPELNKAEWREESRERHEADERHPYAFSFVTLRRQ